MADIAKIGSFAGFLLGLLFFILGFSTPWWTSVTAGGSGNSYGLWMFCGKVSGSKWECSNIDLSETGAKLRATQAMMCLALIACIGSVVLFVLWLAKGSSKSGYLALGVCIVAGFFNLIGVSVYGSEVDTSILGWSFALACCSTILFILDGVIFLVMLVCKGD